MISPLILVAMLAIAPSPAPIATPHATFAPAPLPTKGPDLNLAEQQLNQAQLGVIEYDLIGALLGPYCAKSGGLASDAQRLIVKLMSTWPVSPYPLLVPCVEGVVTVKTAGK